MTPATINDRRIADLSGLMDMMRENAVDREQRIAELEAKATADRKYMDEAETRVAELEEESKRLKGRRNNLEYNEVVALCDRYQAHIEDIAAHATPFGDIPDDSGWIGSYLLTAGALHRALGTLGHSMPSCQAEAELAFVEDWFENILPNDWDKCMERWAERDGT